MLQLHHDIYLFLLHFKGNHPCVLQKARHRAHTKFQLLLLLYMIYAISQISLVTAIHCNIFPVSTLCLTPIIFIYNTLSPPKSSIHKSKSSPFTKNSSPNINSSSTNAKKLSYLCAWSSTHQSSSTLMNFNPGGKAVCIDSGASSCISNDKADFIHLEASDNTVLKGISSSLHIKGTGTLCWKITNDMGNEVSLYVHNSLYVPDAPMCLLSPQSVCQQTKLPSDGFQIYADKGVFTFAGYQKTIHYNQTNNLPIFFTSTNLATPSIPSDISPDIAAFMSSLNHTDNLSSTQRQLLYKHQQLGHLNMTRIQELAHQGLLGTSNQSLANCDPPLCKACLHGKQHKRPVPLASQHPIDASDLCPGDCVSIDQLESTHPGKIPVYKGTPIKSAYHAGTLLTELSNDTMPTMAFLPQNFFVTLAKPRVKTSPFVASMPITRMASPNASLGRQQRELEQC
jgi:hypothetical protein